MDDLAVLVQVMEASRELIHDRVQRGEDLVSDVVLAQVISHVFDRVEFGAVRRERQQVKGRGNLQGCGGMPTGTVQQHQAMVVGKTGGGVRQEQGHGFGIHPRQDQRAELAIEGADGGQAVDELADDLVADNGAQGPRGPTAALIADAAETRFVLKQ